MQARCMSRHFCQNAAMGEIRFVQLAGLQVLHGVAKIARERGIDGRQWLCTGIGSYLPALFTIHSALDSIS